MCPRRKGSSEQIFQRTAVVDCSFQCVRTDLYLQAQLLQRCAQHLGKLIVQQALRVELGEQVEAEAGLDTIQGGGVRTKRSMKSHSRESGMARKLSLGDWQIPWGCRGTQRGSGGDKNDV